MPDTSRYSAHIGYLFNELPLESRIEAARAAGFAAVEHPAPYSVPAKTMAALLRDAGLPYVQFGLRSGNAARGEKGIAIFPDRRDEFRANLAEGLDYAEAIGVRMLHAMAGVLPEAERKPEHRACYLENLRLAAGEAEKRGIRIIVEAMSPAAVPDYFLPTAASAREAIAEAGHPNLGLLLDVFHTVAAGDDPITAIHASREMIAHVHIADHPGRHEPGSGTIDYDAVRSALAEIGYTGFIGCEYVPAGATADGLGWMPQRP
ncbi:hydroxypyruvate isomerase family protein [Aurantimonas endophytica]|uniref:Hydroxypyruvate isomerase n=1 Tax=Aurantimonas endophytica TaxID=1522175 RepID=A0A7W6MPW9_9HYPH|nr:TIM barrel protein [Aurantimonas endophytica]MBB4003465.1 hydroxypyruvate isomerase [Aurantimonas endophytica]MCO6404325.1 TIM barrel protein [Aurantimonas endophytica]